MNNVFLKQTTIIKQTTIFQQQTTFVYNNQQFG